METKNKTSGGRKEGGGGRVGETASCAVVAATTACSFEMMAGKATPVSLSQASTQASAHTSSGGLFLSSLTLGICLQLFVVCCLNISFVFLPGLEEASCVGAFFF